jgi:hypothetical protein
MKNQTLATLELLLEELSHDLIVEKLAKYFITWKLSIELGVHGFAKEPWILILDSLAYKWGYTNDLYLILGEYQEKLDDLMTGTKQLMKSEIIIAMHLNERRKMGLKRFELSSMEEC